MKSLFSGAESAENHKIFGRIRLFSHLSPQIISLCGFRNGSADARAVRCKTAEAGEKGTAEELYYFH